MHASRNLAIFAPIDQPEQHISYMDPHNPLFHYYWIFLTILLKMERNDLVFWSPV